MASNPPQACHRLVLLPSRWASVITNIGSSPMFHYQQLSTANIDIPTLGKYHDYIYTIFTITINHHISMHIRQQTCRIFHIGIHTQSARRVIHHLHTRANGVHTVFTFLLFLSCIIHKHTHTSLLPLSPLLSYCMDVHPNFLFSSYPPMYLSLSHPS